MKIGKGKRWLSLLLAATMCLTAMASTVGWVSAADGTTKKYLPWVEEDNLLEQILQRDGFIEGVWFPWFTHDNLGHGLTANEAMTLYVGQQWASVGIDDYGANKVYREIYNLKVMGFNMMAYAGSAYGEGVIYDDNGDVLGIKADYMKNIRRFLTMCRDIGMPILWNICFHSSSVPDYYGMDAWNYINAMYGNREIADHYAERFVRPLCEVLAEFPDVVAIVALTDEIENETNDSEIGNNFTGGRAMYGNNLDDIQYFVTAMNNVVKEELPNVARTIAANNIDKARYAELDLDLNGHNTYNNNGECSWPEEMVADAPVFLSEYNVSASSHHSEAEMARRHIAYRNDMKLKGHIGGFMWSWQPNSYGEAHSMLPTGADSVTDFRDYLYDVREYTIDSLNAHRGTEGAMDKPAIFFNMGTGVVEWVPSRQATSMDILSSNDNGKTWTTLVEGADQSTYLQGRKCVYKDRRAKTTTIYKIVVHDDAGNTVESDVSNRSDVAVDYVENPSWITLITNSRPYVEKAEGTPGGAEIKLTSFAEGKNRPLMDSLNLIKNASFEDAEGGQWNTDAFFGDVLQVVEDPTAPDGNKSLYFDTSATMQPEWYWFTVDVEKNTEYVFSAWVKGAYIAADNRFYASLGAINPASGKFMRYDGINASREGGQIYPTAWDNEWHLRSVAFNSGEQTKIAIGFYGYSSKMWVDDISLHSKLLGTTYVGEKTAGMIIPTNSDASYCDPAKSATENVNLDDAASTYWQDGSGWKNGFVTITDDKVGYGPSLHYDAWMGVGTYYMKWIDVEPHTRYTFSADVKVQEAGGGCLRLMIDKPKKPEPFYQKFFNDNLGTDWTTLCVTFDTGVYDRIGFAVVDKGGEALIDNIRVFKSADATEGEDEYVDALPDGWYEDENGWYYSQDGEPVKDAWLEDQYYVNENGYRVTNAWKKAEGGWRYLGADGKVTTNKWVKDSIGWCYLGEDGYAVTNCWKKDSHGWCYLNAGGSMTKNAWVKDGGKWYYLDGNGYMVTNAWKKDSVGWVYLGSDGAMLTNAWCKDSQGWCYVGADGYAVTNCWKKDSVGWIWLYASRSMTKNAWIKDGGKWYYLDGEGYMVTNAWKKDSKGWVYVGSDGAMLTNAWCKDSKGWCYVGADGYCVTNCWKKDSHGWIWLDENGSMKKNAWVSDKGNWYYMDGEGYMVYSTTLVIDGKTYTFDKNGVMQ